MRIACSLALVALSACTRPAAILNLDTEGADASGDAGGSDEVGADASATFGEDAGDDEGSPDTGEDDGGLPGEASPVDILVVVDNSGTMGEEQVKLVHGIGGLIEGLEAGGVSDYRVGVTTTDNGGCTYNTTPEGGRLIFESCRERLDEFIFSGFETEDATQYACLDLCDYSGAELAQVPTPTTDSGPAVRPWLQVVDGVSNLENNNIDPLDALGCLLPMGINGCGWESSLESTHKAVARSYIENEESWQFFRHNSEAVIVVVTDEADCSVRNTDIFDPNGNRVFWEDPSAAQANSAACWNAGVHCEGTLDDLDCQATNHDIEGIPWGPEDDAVMHPVERYIDSLQGYDYEHQLFQTRLRFFLIGGAQVDGTVSYSEVGDPEFISSFGTDPGCFAASGDQAVPPVRLRAVAEAMAVENERNIFSVCEGSYQDSFAAIADAVLN